MKAQKAPKYQLVAGFGFFGNQAADFFLVSIEKDQLFVFFFNEVSLIMAVKRIS